MFASHYGKSKRQSHNDYALGNGSRDEEAAAAAAEEMGEGADGVTAVKGPL